MSDRFVAMMARAGELHHDFHALSDHVTSLTDNQTALIDKVRAEGQAMREPLNRLCGSVQFQDVSRQQLEQVGQAMGRVAAHVAALAEAVTEDHSLPDSSVQQCLDTMAQRYVMQQQRDAHHEAAEDAPPAQAIELF